MKTEPSKQKNLGIFYTRPEVVNFIFDMLNIMKNKEDIDRKRWQSHKPRPHYPSIIDPACGEGIFLKRAVESGFTGEDPRFKAPYVWGIDIDETVVNEWEQISILKMFHHDKEKMMNHFYHQNGLIPLKDKPLMYKNAEDGLKQFDAVVGNPPFGGIGVKDITPELENTLFHYEIWKRAFRKNTKIIADQMGLMDTIIDTKEKEKLKSFPIETLFIDRFIQLAKPDGYIGIIIPDGILANSTDHYIREFIQEKTIILAIVSLPRNAFKDAGTNAKTSIMILKKKESPDNQSDNYRIFLASTENIENTNFNKIVDRYKEFYYEQY